MYLYLVVSNGAQCVFLHIAILGSTQRRLGRMPRLVCYSPFIGGFVLLVFQVLVPAQPAMQSYGPALFTLATVFGLIGAGFWVRVGGPAKPHVVVRGRSTRLVLCGQHPLAKPVSLRFARWPRWIARPSAKAWGANP